jgi:hypothetical protein
MIYLELHAPRPSGRRMVTEFSVAGPLGPVLRSAFNDHRITTRDEFTVIRTGLATAPDLADLVRTLVERGLVVQSVQRLTDMTPAQERPEHHDQRR